MWFPKKEWKRENCRWTIQRIRRHRHFDGVRLQRLIFVRGYIFRNVFQPAIQNAAQVVERRCVQGLVFAQLVNGRTGDVMLVDERIGGLS